MEKNKKFAFFKKKSTEFHDFQKEKRLQINNFREKNDETSKDEKKKKYFKKKIFMPRNESIFKLFFQY